MKPLKRKDDTLEVFGRRVLIVDKAQKYEEYKKWPSWRILDKTIKKLEKNKDIIINTDRKLIIFYILKELYGY